MASRLVLDDWESMDRSVFDGETPMEMGARDASRGADLADFIRGIDGIAGFDLNLGKMRIKRVDSEAVIDHHGVPGIIEILGEHDFSGLRCVNRSASGRGEIPSGVRRAGFSIQDAAAAEIPAGSDAF